MATAWFVTNYKRQLGAPRPVRYCAMDEFTIAIRGENGTWSETEVLGGYALVKVCASETLLATIAGTAGFYRLPLASLTDGLASLTAQQRTAIQTRLEAMGYTAEEIQAALGNLRTRNLGEILRFAASRRRKPRYDAVGDQIVLDGEIQTCRSVDDVDAEVTE